MLYELQKEFNEKCDSVKTELENLIDYIESYDFDNIAKSKNKLIENIEALVSDFYERSSMVLIQNEIIENAKVDEKNEEVTSQEIGFKKID